MNDLRDRIAEAHRNPIRFTTETTSEIGAAQGEPVALRWEEAAQLTEAVMPIVDDLAEERDIALAAADTSKMHRVRRIIERSARLVAIERDDARAHAEALAADLQHAERENRRLRADLAKLKR